MRTKASEEKRVLAWLRENLLNNPDITAKEVNAELGTRIHWKRMAALKEESLNLNTGNGDPSKKPGSLPGSMKPIIDSLRMSMKHHGFTKLLVTSKLVKAERVERFEVTYDKLFPFDDDNAVLDG